MRIYGFFVILLLGSAPLVNVAQNSDRSAQQPDPPTVAQAQAFVDAANAELLKLIKGVL